MGWQRAICHDPLWLQEDKCGRPYRNLWGRWGNNLLEISTFSWICDTLVFAVLMIVFDFGWGKRGAVRCERLGADCKALYDVGWCRE